MFLHIHVIRLLEPARHFVVQLLDLFDLEGVDDATGPKHGNLRESRIGDPLVENHLHIQPILFCLNLGKTRSGLE